MHGSAAALRRARWLRTQLIRRLRQGDEITERSRRAKLEQELNPTQPVTAGSCEALRALSAPVHAAPTLHPSE